MRNGAHVKHERLDKARRRVREASIWEKLLSCGLAVVLVVGLAPHFGSVTIAQAGDDETNVPALNDAPAPEPAAAPAPEEPAVDEVVVADDVATPAADETAETVVEKSDDAAAPQAKPARAPQVKLMAQATEDDITISPNVESGKFGSDIDGVYWANGVVTATVTVANVEEGETVTVEAPSATVGAGATASGTYTNTVKVPATDGLSCTITVTVKAGDESKATKTQQVKIDTTAPSAPGAQVKPEAIKKVDNSVFYFDLDDTTLSITAKSTDTDVDAANSEILVNGEKAANWAASGEGFQAVVELQADKLVDAEKTKTENAVISVVLKDKHGNGETYDLVAASGELKFVKHEDSTVKVGLTSETALLPDEIISVTGAEKGDNDYYKGAVTATADVSAAVFQAEGATVTAKVDGTDMTLDGKKYTAAISAEGTHEVVVTVKTASGLEKTYKQTVKVDADGPQFAITWDPATPAKTVNDTEYYETLEATITLTDTVGMPDSVADSLKSAAEAAGGTYAEVSKSATKVEATITFDKIAEEPYSFSVSGITDNAGNPMAGTGVGEDGTYAKEAKFNIVPAPELTVSAQATELDVNGTDLYKDSNTVTFKVTTLKDLMADEPVVTVTKDGTADTPVTVEWAAQEDGITYIGTATFDEAGTYEDLKVAWTSSFDYKGTTGTEATVDIADFIVDAADAVPEVQVYWNTETPVEGIYYGEERIATIVVTDETALDSSSLEELAKKDNYAGATEATVIEGTTVKAGDSDVTSVKDGSVYTTYVVQVKYSDNFFENDKVCTLPVPAVKDAAGHSVETEPAAEFKMLVTPVLKVTNVSKESGLEVPDAYYKDTLVVELSLIALDGQQDEISITTIPYLSGDAPKWTKAEADLTYTAKVVFGDTDGQKKNAIVVSSDTLEFFAPGITDPVKSYTFDNPEEFAVDGTAPVLEVTWAPTDKEKVVSATSDPKEVRYYNTGANATFVITETNGLDSDAGNIVVDFGDGGSVSLGEPTDGKFTLTREYSTNGVFDVVVSGNGDEGGARDRVGWPLTGAAGTEVSSAGIYKTRVVVDNQSPTIVVMVNGEEIADGSENYYSEDATIRVEVADPFFDPANSTFDGESAWKPVEEGSTTYFMEKTLTAEDGAETVYTPTVEAIDLCQNPSSYASTVVIDKKAPEAAIAYFTDYTGSKAPVDADADGAFYANEKITAEVTVTETYFDDAATDMIAAGENGTVSVGGWTEKEPGVHVALVDYDVAAGEEAINDLVVTAYDKAGRQTDPAETTGTVVVDKKAPEAAISYFTAYGAEDQKELAAIDGVYYANEKITAEITVTETYFDDSKTDMIDPGAAGKIVEKDGKQWTNAGEGIYVALVEYEADADTDATSDLVVTAYDKAGNPTDPVETTGTVVVDKVAPKLTVTFPAALDSENKAQEGEILYFADKVVATVAIDDNYIDPKNDITLNLPAGATMGEWTAENTVEVTFAAPAEGEDVEYNIQITGADKAGNPIISGDESTFVNEANEYATTVRIDKKAPVLTVTWDNNDVLNGKYFKASRTPTITIEEKYFKASNIMVDGAATTDEDWESDGDVRTYKKSPIYPDSKGKNCVLSIKGNDYSQNPLTGGDATGTKPAEATAAAGEYESAPFVVDTVDPVVTISMTQERKGQLESAKTDFYSEGNQLQATVSVADDNFGPKVDEANASTITLAGTYDADYAKANWADDGSYTITFTPNDAEGAPESNSLSVTVFDLAGNTTTYAYGDAENDKKGKTVDTAGTISGNENFALDITAPVLDPGSGTNIPNNAYSQNYGDTFLFYRTPTTLYVILNDVLGIESVTGEGSGYSFDSFQYEKGDKSWALQVTLVDGKEFTNAFIVTATDLAKNYRKWMINPKTGEVEDVTKSDKTNTPLYRASQNLYPEKLILDTTAPIVTLADKGLVGNYYNTTQTVTTTVEELNFSYLKSYDGGQVITTMTKQEGNAGRATSVETYPVSAFEGGGSVFTNVFSAVDDGHYSFKAHITDPAGNEASDELGEFTIDKTAPTVQVTWDNNDVRNGKYYKAGRNATVTITEHNFDPSQFTIQTTGSVGGWSSNGDTHTAIVSFGSDGTYTMTVSGQDRAGNALATYNEPEFVVDLTSPKITFSNVEEYHAYNDIIAPVIIYEDEANFDSNGMSYTLTGSKNGVQTLPAGQSVSGNTGTVSYVDFERIVEVDDIYKIDAHLTDLAGNEADNSITFSVNRFGSNFIIIDEEEYTENNGYLAEAREVLVREINVCGAPSEEHGVSVTHGLSTENLKHNNTGTPTSDGFYIESGVENYGWSTYLYHIGSGNFTTDGNYHVVINSKDNATNLNNSAAYYDPEEHATADAEVSFILDTADPLIEGVNVSNDGLYDAGKQKLSFTVTDNIGFDKDAVKVTIDGNEQIVEPEASGLCTVDIDAKSWTPRNMQIEATDYAGRTAAVDVKGFRWTTDFLELNLPLVIGAAVVILGGGGGALVLRNRRKQEDEQ